jgi:hypothetical protein
MPQHFTCRRPQRAEFEFLHTQYFDHAGNRLTLRFDGSLRMGDLRLVRAGVC